MLIESSNVMGQKKEFNHLKKIFNRNINKSRPDHAERCDALLQASFTHNHFYIDWSEDQKCWPTNFPWRRPEKCIICTFGVQLTFRACYSEWKGFGFNLNFMDTHGPLQGSRLWPLFFFVTRWLPVTARRGHPAACSTPAADSRARLGSITKR